MIRGCVEEHQPCCMQGDSGNITAVRRQPGREKPFGSWDEGDLTGLQIRLKVNAINGRIPFVDSHFFEDDGFPVVRPGWIGFGLVWASGQKRLWIPSRGRDQADFPWMVEPDIHKRDSGPVRGPAGLIGSNR